MPCLYAFRVVVWFVFFAVMVRYSLFFSLIFARKKCQKKYTEGTDRPRDGGKDYVSEQGG